MSKQTAEKTTTAITRFNIGALADNNMPEYLKEALGNAAGRDNIDRDDVLIPRLGLAQTGMSPQLKKSSDLFIPELEAGKLFNTTTNEIYGKSVILVPILFFKQWIQFAPGGGGVERMFDSGKDVPAEDLQFKDGKSPKVTEFKNRLSLLIAEGRKPEPIVASFKSSGMKTAKKWNSLITGTNLPAFARSYRFSVVDKRKGAQEWFGLDVQPDLFVPEEFFKFAKTQFDIFSQGGFKVDDKGVVDDQGGGEDGDEKVNF